MKNILVLLMIILSLGYSQAQTTVNLSKDSTFSGKVYAGIVGITGFSVESSDVSVAIPIRFGASLNWNPSKAFFLQTFGSYDLGSKLAIGSFSAGINMSWFRLQFGYFGPVSTVNHRPHPVSAAGQFETWTTSLIPGGGTTATVSFSPKKKPLSFSLSCTIRSSTQFEYHGGFVFDEKLKVSAWATNDKFGGGVITYNGKKWRATLVGTPKNIAVFCGVDVYKSVSIYFDAGVDSWLSKNSEGRTNLSLARGEFGILNSFSYKFLKGLVGVGYAQETKQVKGYLFLHI
ncbi:hypothetical protein GW765_01840 [Candidatus Parcubacteria bacterium]|nr:hypothetical protein [Candidatus Parcubacteria bacterium]